MIFRSFLSVSLITFFTREVLPILRGEMSIVLTPAPKFILSLWVSFTRSVKLSPVTDTPNMNVLSIFVILMPANVDNLFLVYNIVVHNFVDHNVVD